MPIITVSRGTYSGGKDLAECLARSLDIPCISREIIVEAAQRFGVSEEILSEAMGRTPSFFERFSRQRDMYLAFLRSALLQQAAKGSFVYHGHAGHLLLANVPTVIRIRVVAPLSSRLASATARLGIDQKEAARHIKRVDKHRQKWTRFLYGVEWQDPSLYDLVINLEHLEIAQVCQAVCEIARQKCHDLTDEAKKIIADQALASLVFAELARDERTQGADMQITASAGVVTVRGKTRDRSVRDAIPQVVQGVPGVVEVKLEVAIYSEVPG